MIRKSRSHRSRWRQSASNPANDSGGVLPAHVFDWELKKEIYRADRRQRGREFGLIRLSQPSGEIGKDFVNAPVMLDIRNSLRITDSIGWYQDGLAILLPEADKEGTLVVANFVAASIEKAGLDLQTEVSIYPIDDELISLARELQETEQPDSDDEGTSDDSPSDDQGIPFSEDTIADSDVTIADSFRPEDLRETGGTSQATAVLPPKLARKATIVLPTREWAKMREALEEMTPAKRLVHRRHRFVPSRPTPWWKRSIDILGAGVGLVALSPVFAVAAVAIKLNSSGPVFFLQQREGKDGKRFGIVKFRTMVVNAEAMQDQLRDKSEQDGPAFKLTHDPRVTVVGRYLRKSCVDELPQLINVLKGDMSLVGPRPLPVNESLACSCWQRARLTVLPGLTCTWQAHGGRDVKFEQWMKMDLDYIDRQSFWGDVKLIFETACLALMHRGSV